MQYEMELFAPKELIDELHKHCDEVCVKSRISKELFLEDISLLPELIEFRDVSPFFTAKAHELILDKTDVSFLALAFELNVPIWSNDPHLKQQSSIKVFSTKELLEFLSKTEL